MVGDRTKEKVSSLGDEEVERVDLSTSFHLLAGTHCSDRTDTVKNRRMREELVCWWKSHTSDESGSIEKVCFESKRKSWKVSVETGNSDGLEENRDEGKGLTVRHGYSVKVNFDDMLQKSRRRKMWRIAGPKQAQNPLVVSRGFFSRVRLSKVAGGRRSAG